MNDYAKLRRLARERAEEGLAWKRMEEFFEQASDVDAMIAGKKSELASLERKLKESREHIEIARQESERILAKAKAAAERIQAGAVDSLSEAEQMREDARRVLEFAQAEANKLVSEAAVSRANWADGFQGVKVVEALPDK